RLVLDRERRVPRLLERKIGQHVTARGMGIPPNARLECAGQLRGGAVGESGDGLALVLRQPHPRQVDLAQDAERQRQHDVLRLDLETRATRLLERESEASIAFLDREQATLESNLRPDGIDQAPDEL